jgi:Na+-transporting methylmalonyl-CoA/oxaloacetate decarboxylase gamma subunit
MKDFLLPFVYGHCVLVIVGGIVWLLLEFLGLGFVALVLLLILVWSVGSSIRDTIKDMKEKDQ